jgi:hypothetical protein
VDVLILQSPIHTEDGIPSEPSATCGGEVEFVLLLLPEPLVSNPLLSQDMGLQPTLQSTVLENQIHSEAVPKHM